MWAKQRPNESRLRVANSPTELLAADLCGPCMNAACDFLGLQLLVAHSANVEETCCHRQSSVAGPLWG